MTQSGPAWPSSGNWGGQPGPQWSGGQQQPPGGPVPQQQWSAAPPTAPAPARSGDQTPLIVGLVGILAMLATVIVVYVKYLQM